MRMKVNCSECGETHYTEDNIETVNIEEDIQGFDLLTYICPVTQKQTKSYVLVEQ